MDILLLRAPWADKCVGEEALPMQEDLEVSLRSVSANATTTTHIAPVAFLPIALGKKAIWLILFSKPWSVHLLSSGGPLFMDAGTL